MTSVTVASPHALLRFEVLQSFPELVHGISDRTSGSMYPQDAGGRPRLAAALGIPERALVPTRQVHGSEIVRVPDPGWDDARGKDGLITVTPGRYLLGYFADCVPLLAYDPVRRAVGLAHAGWRGTVQRIAERLVAELVAAFGVQPEDLRVGIGPSIGPCCYEVGTDVIAQVREELPEGGELLRSGRPGHAFFDLWAANRQGLVRAGVRPAHIEVTAQCTSCHVERFFSYRREGQLNGLFGAVIGIRPEVANRQSPIVNRQS